MKIKDVLSELLARRLPHLDGVLDYLSLIDLKSVCETSKDLNDYVQESYLSRKKPTQVEFRAMFGNLETRPVEDDRRRVRNPRQQERMEYPCPEYEFYHLCDDKEGNAAKTSCQISVCKEGKEVGTLTVFEEGEQGADYYEAGFHYVGLAVTSKFVLVEVCTPAANLAPVVFRKDTLARLRFAQISAFDFSDEASSIVQFGRDLVFAQCHEAAADGALVPAVLKLNPDTGEWEKIFHDVVRGSPEAFWMKEANSTHAVLSARYSCGSGRDYIVRWGLAEIRGSAVAIDSNSDIPIKVALTDKSAFVAKFVDGKLVVTVWDLCFGDRDDVAARKIAARSFSLEDSTTVAVDQVTVNASQTRVAFLLNCVDGRSKELKAAVAIRLADRSWSLGLFDGGDAGDLPGEAWPCFTAPAPCKKIGERVFRYLVKLRRNATLVVMLCLDDDGLVAFRKQIFRGSLLRDQALEAEREKEEGVVACLKTKGTQLSLLVTTGAPEDRTVWQSVSASQSVAEEGEEEGGDNGSSEPLAKKMRPR